MTQVISERSHARRVHFNLAETEVIEYEEVELAELPCEAPSDDSRLKLLLAQAVVQLGQACFGVDSLPLAAWTAAWLQMWSS